MRTRRVKTLSSESLLGAAGTGGGAAGHAPAHVTVLYFAAARQAAGVSKEPAEGETLAAVLEDARDRHGEAFAAVLDGCRVWVNGEPADPGDRLCDGDEVAVLPPVSGGTR